MRRLSLVLACVALVLVTTNAFAVSLKNFRELLAFYSSATGVPATDTKVQATYANVKSRLPKAGTPDELSSASVLGAVELGGAFCGSFITADAAKLPDQRRAHQSIDFTKSPRALGDADIAAVIGQYARLFWLRPTNAVEDKVFLAEIGRLKTSSTDNAAGTKQLLLTMCTQVASSLDALVTR